MHAPCDMTVAEAGRGGDKDKGKQPLEDECDWNDSSDSEDESDRGLGRAAGRSPNRSDGAGPSSPRGEWDGWAGMSPPPEEPVGV